MSSGKSEKQNHDECNEQAATLRSNHDIRASIALTKGFNKALELSLSDLSQALHQALVMHNADPNGEPTQRIRGLEQDCHFCVLRISRSLEQLDERLNADTRLALQPTPNTRHDDA